MTKSIGPLLFFLLFSFNSGGHLELANGSVEVPQNSTSWCVAKPSASDVELKSNIEYACNTLSDCKLIQEGGSCFYPNTLINHASIVMNQYYALNGRKPWNCNFSGSGLIVISDPSYGGCKYA